MLEADLTFQLRYVGDRFNGPRLPLDVISDLPAFRDLLVAFAKEEWRSSHAQMKRLPKGFDKSISFDLVAIERGSAVPKLEWDRRSIQSSLPGISDQLHEIVERSFANIVTLLDKGEGHQFPLSLSSDHIRALNRLGSGLRDGERIELIGSRDAGGNVVYLDTLRRKSLITRVRETYQTRYEGIGVLKGLHIDGFLYVATDEHGELKIPVDSNRIMEEFATNIESQVQFALQVELDNNDHIRAIANVFDIELMEAERLDEFAHADDEVGAGELSTCLARLSSLRALSAGWFDGQGEKPQSAALSAAAAFLGQQTSLAPLFSIFPSLEGGVSIEFQSSGWDYTVEFHSDGKVEMYGVQIDGSDELEPTLFNGVDQEFSVFFTNRIS